MPPIRSLLWIGRGRSFAGDLVADAPTLDLVWEAELEPALALACAPHDAVVLDADDCEAALVGLERLLAAPCTAPVIVRLDADAPLDRAAWLERGAAEVLPRPQPDQPDLSGRELVACVERVLSRAARTARPADGRTGRPSPSAAIVGDSPAMRGVFALVERAARSRGTVLVSGETGTGKELIARAVHDAGRRRSGEFIGLNCAAFPDSLLESELFGHAKGAFTGASREREGLFVAANRGTLFLDEVSETSEAFQAKLLRALQEREVRALGSSRARRVDVRIIAASNRDLAAEVHAGRFREDLYYRLAVFPIHVPPLRERRDDVLALAAFFAQLHGDLEGVSGVTLSPRAETALTRYAWPGNVRELENEIQRALALVEPHQRLEPAHFSERVRGGAAPLDTRPRSGETLRATLQRIEAALLRSALAEHAGRRAATARTLGITREGLYKKMKRYGIG